MLFYFSSLLCCCCFFYIILSKYIFLCKLKSHNSLLKVNNRTTMPDALWLAPRDSEHTLCQAVSELDNILQGKNN